MWRRSDGTESSAVTLQLSVNACGGSGVLVDVHAPRCRLAEAFPRTSRTICRSVYLNLLLRSPFRQAFREHWSSQQRPEYLARSLRNNSSTVLSPLSPGNSGLLTQTGRLSRSQALASPARASEISGHGFNPHDTIDMTFSFASEADEQKYIYVPLNTPGSPAELYVFLLGNNIQLQITRSTSEQKSGSLKTLKERTPSRTAEDLFVELTEGLCTLWILREKQDTRSAVTKDLLVMSGKGPGFGSRRPAPLELGLNGRVEGTESPNSATSWEGENENGSKWGRESMGKSGKGTRIMEKLRSHGRPASTSPRVFQAPEFSPRQSLVPRSSSGDEALSLKHRLSSVGQEARTPLGPGTHGSGSASPTSSTIVRRPGMSSDMDLLALGMRTSNDNSASSSFSAASAGTSFNTLPAELDPSEREDLELVHMTMPEGIVLTNETESPLSSQTWRENPSRQRSWDLARRRSVSRDRRPLTTPVNCNRSVGNLMFNGANGLVRSLNSPCTLKRRVEYVTVELRYGDQVLIESSHTFLPQVHAQEAAALQSSVGAGPWRGEDLPVKLPERLFLRTLRMRLLCGKMRQNTPDSIGASRECGDGQGRIVTAAKQIAAEQLGVPPDGIIIDGDSVLEDGVRVGPSASYPGLITEYHSFIVRGELKTGCGYGQEKWAQLTGGGSENNGTTWVTRESLPNGCIMFHHWFLMEAKMWEMIRARNVHGVSESMSLGHAHGVATSSVLKSRTLADENDVVHLRTACTSTSGAAGGDGSMAHRRNRSVHADDDALRALAAADRQLSKEPREYVSSLFAARLGPGDRSGPANDVQPASPGKGMKRRSSFLSGIFYSSKSCERIPSAPTTKKMSVFKWPMTRQRTKSTMEMSDVETRRETMLTTENYVEYHKRRSMDVRRSMDNERRSMDNGRRSMDDARRSMDGFLMHLKDKKNDDIGVVPTFLSSPLFSSVHSKTTENTN